MDLLPTHHPACRPLVVTTGRARRNATRPCRDPPCSPAPARRVRGGAIWRAVHSLAYHPRVGRCRGTEFMATPPRFSSQPLAPCAEAGRYECDPEHVCGVRTVDVNNETAQQGITRDRESAVARRILSPGIARHAASVEFPLIDRLSSPGSIATGHGSFGLCLRRLSPSQIFVTSPGLRAEPFHRVRTVCLRRREPCDRIRVAPPSGRALTAPP